ERNVRTVAKEGEGAYPNRRRWRNGGNRIRKGWCQVIDDGFVRRQITHGPVGQKILRLILDRKPVGPAESIYRGLPHRCRVRQFHWQCVSPSVCRAQVIIRKGMRV